MPQLKAGDWVKVLPFTDGNGTYNPKGKLRSPGQVVRTDEHMVEVDFGDGDVTWVGWPLAKLSEEELAVWIAREALGLNK